MEEQLDINEKIINQLIGLQEIEEMKKAGNKKLSLHHSSIAKLYFSAYLRFPYLGRRTKKTILNGRCQEDLEYCSFYRYMTTLTDQRNVVDVAIYLDDLILLKKLVEEDNIQKSIEKALEKEEDIKKIGNCISNIASTSKEGALKLVDSINIDALSLKIDKEEDIIKIWSCVSGIAEASKEVALKLVDSVSARINKEEDIEKIGQLICWDVMLTLPPSVDKEIGLKLANSIDIDALASKINQEEDIEKIGQFLFEFESASKEVGLRLVNMININTLATKIEKEENIRKIGLCVSFLEGRSKEIGLKLVNLIDIDVLVSKIKHEEDMGQIETCLVGIAWASEDVGLKLVDSVSSKINQEEDIGNVGECVSQIAAKSQEVALKLLESIDINTLSSKINKEKNIYI